MKKIIIKKIGSGERIDKFLKKEFFNNEEITRGQIIKEIKNGNIKINGKVVKPSYILKPNDEIGISLSKRKVALEENKNVPFEIVHADENIIVVNKPAGVQTHPSEKKENDTLVNGLIKKFPEIKNIGDSSTGLEQFNMRPGIVHRLDRETSGIIVIARNQKTFLELKEKFMSRKIKKTYQAIIYGNFEKYQKSGLIEKPIARSSDYKKQVIAGRKTKTKVRPAITKYKVIKEIPGFSFLEVKPQTGRMHQIRVHMNSIGHPIVGDKTYKTKGVIPEKGAYRHLLHAKKLEFSLFGKNYTFKAPIPQDFENFWNYLDEKTIKG